MSNLSSTTFRPPNISKAVTERMGYIPVDTGNMPEAAAPKQSIKSRETEPTSQETLDYVIDQQDVNAMNKLSRKVGAITSIGDATSKQWKKCVNAQLAHDSCQDGYKIGSVIPVDGCRISNGYDEDKGSVTFLVPDNIKAPMTQSNKLKYTEGYNTLKNILVNNDGPSTLEGSDRTFSGQTLRCENYNLETRKGGRKSRGKKRGRKTRGKKRVKKTRTKRKHVKKSRTRKHKRSVSTTRKTRGKKMSKRRGTRKRSYRKRR